MSRTSLLSLAATVATAAPSLAQTSEMQLESLSVIPGVYVEVDGVTPEAAAHGLSVESLRDAIEADLDRADILALTKPEWQQVIGNPGLHLSIQLLAPSQHLYIYSMTLEVRQLARLARDSTKLVYTRTWGAGTLIGTVPATSVSTLQDRVRPLVRRFISAYNSAGSLNRRRAASTPNVQRPMFNVQVLASERCFSGRAAETRLSVTSDLSGR